MIKKRMKSYSQQKVNGFYKSHAANKGLLWTSMKI